LQSGDNVQRGQELSIGVENVKQLLHGAGAALRGRRSNLRAPSYRCGYVHGNGTQSFNHKVRSRFMISSKAFAWGLAILVFLGTAGLQAQTPSSMVPVSTSASGRAQMGSSPQLEQRYPRYKIQRQDVLLLTFPITPELNQTVTVQPDGFINLQGAGSVHVQGMTVPELTVALKKAYAGTLHDPIIDVDLQDYQKPFFTVSGQVGKPGQYDLRGDITVAEALAVAGGMAPTSKTQVFLFHRTSNDWYEVKKLNMKDILNGKNANEDPMIQPGDMIYVPENFITKFRKYLPYSVNAGTFLDQTP
jgi:polysaccharide biosynthesis/export protein